MMKMVAMLLVIACFGCFAGETPEQICRTSVDAAKRMIELKQLEPAKALLEAAIKVKGDDPEALTIRAQIRLDEQDYVGALDDAKAAQESLHKNRRLSTTREEVIMLEKCANIIAKADKVDGTMKRAIETVEEAKKELKRVAEEIRHKDQDGYKKLLELESRIVINPGKETTTKKVENVKKNEIDITKIIGKWKCNDGIVTINKSMNVSHSNGYVGILSIDKTSFTVTWKNGYKHGNMQLDQTTNKFIGKAITSDNVELGIWFYERIN
jgi:tetratricopeptide (TPR) repeat protein